MIKIQESTKTDDQEDLDQEEEEFKTQFFQQITQRTTNFSVLSEFKAQYQKKFKDVSTLKKEKLISKLAHHNIIFNECYVPKMRKFIYHKEGNSIIFEVNVGYFSTKINFLKVNKDSLDYQREIISCGCYSKIYKCKIKNNTYAIKSQDIMKKDKANLNAKISKILEEYFYYKIASILGFGPFLDNILGYDVICFNDKIQFAMELLEKRKQMKIQKKKMQLLKNIKTMHTIKLVHRDVKEDNVGWSSHFKKWVFIDFGFAEMLKEDVGEKTYSGFIGTYKFTTKQLKTIFHLNKPGRVDFYYNDIYGLELLRQNFQEKKQILQNDEGLFQFLKEFPIFYDDNYSKKLQLYCLFFKIKYLSFYQMEKQIDTFVKQHEQIYQVFLTLLMLKIEKLKEDGKEKQSKKLFEKYKLYHEQSNKIELNFQEKLIIKQIKEYIQHEDRQQQKQLEDFAYYYDNDQDLKNYIQKNWNTNHFMQNLLTFFNEAYFSTSKRLLQRFKRVCDIIAEFFLYYSEDQSWFWKFRKILMEIQRYFLREEKLNLLYLNIILKFYDKFRDFINYEKLAKAINFKQEIEKYSKYLENIMKQCDDKFELQAESHHENILIENNFQVSYLSGMDKIVGYSEEGKKTIDKIIEQMRLKNYRRSKNIQKLNLCYDAGTQSKYTITVQTSKWNIANEDKFQKYLEDKKNKFVFPKMNEMETNYRSFPFFEQIPIFQNIFYQIQIGNVKKAQELNEDLMEMWKQQIEIFSRDIPFIHQCIEKSDNVSRVVDFFIYYSLDNLKIQKMRDYYLFIEYIFEQYSPKWNKQIYKKQLSNYIKIVHEVYQYFNEQNLTKYQQIVLKCFNTLLKHYRNQQVIQQLQWIFQESKNIQNILRYQILTLISTFIFYDVFGRVLTSLGQSYLQQIDNCPQFHKISLFQYSSSYLLAITIVLNYKKQYFKLYRYYKQYTAYITNNKIEVIDIDQQLKYFQKSLTQVPLKKFISEIMRCQNLKSMRGNNFLSAIMFVVYLKTQRIFPQDLQAQKKRLLLLSMIKIDSYPSNMKIEYRNKIILRLSLIKKQNKTKRKKMIYFRKVCYASKKTEKYEELVQKKVNKFRYKTNINDQIISTFNKIYQNLQTIKKTQ